MKKGIAQDLVTFSVMSLFLFLLDERTKVKALDCINGTLNVDSTSPESVTITCLGESPGDTLSWFRHDSAIDQSSKSSKYGIQSFKNNNSLMISQLTVSNVGEMEVGNYTCRNQDNREIKVHILAKPVVKWMGRSVSVVEGHEATLTCHAWGWPLPSVVWSRGSTVMGAGTPEVTLQSSKVMGNELLDNSILKIAHLNQSNQAEYNCVAMNSLGTNNRSIIIRVHDRLEPLWPFIGIVLIVLVVIIIIVIATYMAKDKTA